MNLAFLGTAELARVSLERILERPDWNVRMVVTQPDRPSGRHLKPQPSPVKRLAAEHGLPVFQPERVRSREFLDLWTAEPLDVAVVAAYGQILPPSVLQHPRAGCVNVHASLLPRFRGAGPIQWAILNGDPETGVTLMQMDRGMDTGPMIAAVRTPIRDEDDAATLHDRLAAIGADLLVASLERWVAGELPAVPQDEAHATHAPKLSKEDGWIPWENDARTCWNRVRGLHPWPGAFSVLASRGERLRIHRAHPLPDLEGGEPGAVLRADAGGFWVACGSGGLALEVVQRDGGRALPAADFLRGFPIGTGERFAGSESSPGVNLA